MYSDGGLVLVNLGSCVVVKVPVEAARLTSFRHIRQRNAPAQATQTRDTIEMVDCGGGAAGSGQNKSLRP